MSSSLITHQNKKLKKKIKTEEKQKKGRTFEERLLDLGRRSPEEVGIGVLGIGTAICVESPGFGEAQQGKLKGEASSSKVLGTYKQRLSLRARLAFLHVLPMLLDS